MGDIEKEQITYILNSATEANRDDKLFIKSKYWNDLSDDWPFYEDDQRQIFIQRKKKYSKYHHSHKSEVPAHLSQSDSLKPLTQTAITSNDGGTFNRVLDNKTH